MNLYPNNSILYLKIYGERNTGTNYLQKLVANNYYCDFLNGVTQGTYYRNLARALRSNGVKNSIEILQDYQDKEHFRKVSSDYGWKHACAPIDVIAESQHKFNTLFLILIKNPYTWISSLYKNPYDWLGGRYPVSIDEFVKHKWDLTKRDNINEKSLNSPIELYTKKYASYIELTRKFPENVHIIKYEDLISNPEITINFLKSSFTQIDAQNFKNIEDSTKKNSNENFLDYRKKYLETPVSKIVSKSIIERVNYFIPDQIFEHYNYLRL